MHASPFKTKVEEFRVDQTNERRGKTMSQKSFRTVAYKLLLISTFSLTACNSSPPHQTNEPEVKEPKKTADRDYVRGNFLTGTGSSTKGSEDSATERATEIATLDLYSKVYKYPALKPSNVPDSLQSKLAKHLKTSCPIKNLTVKATPEKKTDGSTKVTIDISTKSENVTCVTDRVFKEAISCLSNLEDERHNQFVILLLSNKTLTSPDSYANPETAQNQTVVGASHAITLIETTSDLTKRDRVLSSLLRHDYAKNAVLRRAIYTQLKLEDDLQNPDDLDNDTVKDLGFRTIVERVKTTKDLAAVLDHWKDAEFKTEAKAAIVTKFNTLIATPHTSQKHEDTWEAWRLVPKIVDRNDPLLFESIKILYELFFGGEGLSEADGDLLDDNEELGVGKRPRLKDFRESIPEEQTENENAAAFIKGLDELIEDEESYEELCKALDQADQQEHFKLIQDHMNEQPIQAKNNSKLTALVTKTFKASLESKGLTAPTQAIIGHYEEWAQLFSHVSKGAPTQFQAFTEYSENALERDLIEIDLILWFKLEELSRLNKGGDESVLTKRFIDDNRLEKLLDLLLNSIASLEQGESLFLEYSNHSESAKKRYQKLSPQFNRDFEAKIVEHAKTDDQVRQLVTKYGIGLEKYRAFEQNQWSAINSRFIKQSPKVSPENWFESLKKHRFKWQRDGQDLAHFVKEENAYRSYQLCQGNTENLVEFLKKHPKSALNGYVKSLLKTKIERHSKRALESNDPAIITSLLSSKVESSWISEDQKQSLERKLTELNKERESLKGDYQIAQTSGQYNDVKKSLDRLEKSGLFKSEVREMKAEWADFMNLRKTLDKMIQEKNIHGDPELTARELSKARLFCKVHEESKVKNVKEHVIFIKELLARLVEVMWKAACDSGEDKRKQEHTIIFGEVCVDHNNKRILLPKLYADSNSHQYLPIAPKSCSKKSKGGKYVHRQTNLTFRFAPRPPVDYQFDSEYCQLGQHGLSSDSTKQELGIWKLSPPKAAFLIAERELSVGDLEKLAKGQTNRFELLKRIKKRMGNPEKEAALAMVTPDEAQKICKWFDGDCRLPTAAEWIWAYVKSTPSYKYHNFKIIGGEVKSGVICQQKAAVEARRGYSRGQMGLRNISGNLSEWVSDSARSGNTHKLHAGGWFLLKKSETTALGASLHAVGSAEAAEAGMPYIGIRPVITLKK